jgi:SAM-dependent methyltransferase
MFTPARILVPELLDEHDAPAADVTRSLEDLRFINKYGRGIGIYRGLLRRLLGNDRDRPLRVLDLGTGSSDLLDSLHRYPRLLPIGLDFNIRHLLHVPPGSRVRRVVGDANRLPFRDSSVDVVTSSHFFHHFTDDENVGILNDSLRVARAGVIVSDVRRHHVSLAFVRLVGALRLIGRITRFDAPASILRGYTAPEVRQLLARVRASKWQVGDRFPSPSSEAGRPGRRSPRYWPVRDWVSPSSIETSSRATNYAASSSPTTPSRSSSASASCNPSSMCRVSNAAAS